MKHYESEQKENRPCKITKGDTLSTWMKKAAMITTQYKPSGNIPKLDTLSYWLLNMSNNMRAFMKSISSFHLNLSSAVSVVEQTLWEINKACCHCNLPWDCVFVGTQITRSWSEKGSREDGDYQVLSLTLRNLKWKSLQKGGLIFEWKNRNNNLCTKRGLIWSN